MNRIYSPPDRSIFKREKITMKLHLLICVVLLSHSLCSGDQHDLTSVVQTDKGPVQGEIRTTVWNSVPYSSFRGIPYGKPPVGYARFKPPQEAEPWSETFQATSEGTPCPQIDMLSQNYVGNEDCLNLNVYTPKMNFSNGDGDEKLKPVMVWIYGGSFIRGNTGSTVYGPDFLIEEGVVVVAMNYRLGMLGFLALNEANATGNAALKDQLLALKWVQRNIKNFGGDPNSVTIFGESAGAASVDYHFISDRSKGLFHRAISMSGSPVSIWAFGTRAEASNNAFKVGRELGIHTLSKTKLLEELYNQSAEAIVKATQELSLLMPLFKPAVEDPKKAGDDSFLTECAYSKYESGNFSDVPYLTGYMADETLLFLLVAEASGQSSKKRGNLLEQIESSSIIKKMPSFLKKITQVGAKSIDKVARKGRQDVIKYTTDILYVAGTETKQKLVTKHSSQPVYYYRNSFISNNSLHSAITGSNELGAAHADDVAYCWHVSIAKFPTDPDDPLVITQKRVTRMWTNFAKYSNPTPNGADDKLLNIIWPVSGPEGIHLEIGSDLSVGPRPINKFANNFRRNSKLVIEALSGCGAIKI